MRECRFSLTRILPYICMFYAVFHAKNKKPSEIFYRVSQDKEDNFQTLFKIQQQKRQPPEEAFENLTLRLSSTTCVVVCRV